MSRVLQLPSRSRCAAASSARIPRWPRRAWRRRRLRTDVKRESEHVYPQLGGQPRQFQRRFRIAAEFARQVGDRAGTAIRHAQQQGGAPGSGRNLRTSSGLSATKVLTPYSSALRMSLGRLIGCVWMQQRRVDAQARYQLHFARGGQIQQPTLCDHGPDHRRMRQRLERVVQVHAGSAFCRRRYCARMRSQSTISSGEP